jgi:hypothetical protein
VRRRDGHPDQIRAVAASQLEHPAAPGRRRTQPEQRRLQGEAVRVRLGEGASLVGDVVVEGAQELGKDATTGVPAEPSGFCGV